MDVIIRHGFLPITIGLNRPKFFEKGRHLVESEHVLNVEDLKAGICSYIRGVVVRQTSVNKPPYNLKIEVDLDKRITKATCECAAGESGKCKHVSALAHFVNTEGDTKTSHPATWGVPTKIKIEKYTKGRKIADMFQFFLSISIPNILVPIVNN